MYFIMFAIMASVVLVGAIPIALIIALLSPQDGTRLAPEQNPAFKGFAVVIAIVVAALILLGVCAI